MQKSQENDHAKIVIAKNEINVGKRTDILKNVFCLLLISLNV